jgi:hypothetical protein
VFNTRIIYFLLHFMLLWSSGHSSWLQMQRYRVRLPALPDFLRSSGSGTGSTQPREVIEELLERKLAAPV